MCSTDRCARSSCKVMRVALEPLLHTPVDGGGSHRPGVAVDLVLRRVEQQYISLSAGSLATTGLMARQSRRWSLPRRV